jgi:hypothetical protein
MYILGLIICPFPTHNVVMEVGSIRNEGIVLVTDLRNSMYSFRLNGSPVLKFKKKF